MRKQEPSAMEKLAWENAEENQGTEGIHDADMPRWISVKERLPEQRINQYTLDFEYVLCATSFGDVRPYKYGRRIGQMAAHFWSSAGYVDAYVTHWMQLPEPPKEEDHVD